MIKISLPGILNFSHRK